MADESIKKFAIRALRIAGRAHLGDLGAVPNRSARFWTIDRGWWLINIEFQPSGWSVGSYLNVGLQHLWLPREHRVFEHHSRLPIPGHGQYVEFGDNEAANAAAANALAQTARASAQQWLWEFTSDDAHLEWLTTKTDDPYDAFNAAFALARLGRAEEANNMFSLLPGRLDPSVPWQAELAAEAVGLATVIGGDDPDLAQESELRVAQSRNRVCCRFG